MRWRIADSGKWQLYFIYDNIRFCYGCDYLNQVELMELIKDDVSFTNWYSLIWPTKKGEILKMQREELN